MLVSKSSQSYCPAGSIDYEDENGKVIPGHGEEILATLETLSHSLSVENDTRRMLMICETSCATMSMDQVLYHGSGKCLLLSLITDCAGFLLVRYCEDLVIITFKKSHTAIGHTVLYNSEHFSKYK